MKECVWAIYFSPTGGTKKAALYLAEGLGKEVKEVDLSAPDFNGAEFKKDDLVIVAAPAFGGRIPALMAERLKCTAGKGAAAVTAAVYGNRAYEDALVELNDALEEQGFEPFASVAVLAEHSMVREVAAGRPDAKDHEELSGFGAQILKKLEAAEITRPQVPGNRPYKEWKKMPAVPGKRQRLYRVRTLRRTLSLWSYFKRKSISDRSGEMYPVPALHRCLVLPVQKSFRNVFRRC